MNCLASLYNNHDPSFAQWLLLSLCDILQTIDSFIWSLSSVCSLASPWRWCCVFNLPPPQPQISSPSAGAAIFFEFKHYKPKKRFTSTKCFAFLEMDEIKPGPIVIELWVTSTRPLTAILPTFRAQMLTVAPPPPSSVYPPRHFTHPFVAPQVQEADRLQAEEAAAADQETAVSPPAPDDTQGQLSQGLKRGAFSSSIAVSSCLIPQ